MRVPRGLIYGLPVTRARTSESGQAVVEAAIILPAMIFLLLCTIQLTQLQQARIMAEYAAFSAARAGIVMNANNGTGKGGSDGPMHDAAVLAILPTFGRADSFTAIAKTLVKFKAQDAVLKPFGLGQVRVYLWSPDAAAFDTYGKHLNGKELDFDDVRPAVLPHTLLSLQVRYFYEMRVPFANKLLQTIWMASKLGAAGGLRSWRGWDLTAPKIGSQKGPDAVATARALALGRTVPDGTPEGISLTGLSLAGNAGRYFMPVEAWYTMRMQSNPYRKWAR
jgi:hypothetical protein